jgi:hypothetical protein
MAARMRWYTYAAVDQAQVAQSDRCYPKALQATAPFLKPKILNCG